MSVNFLLNHRAGRLFCSVKSVGGNQEADRPPTLSREQIGAVPTPHVLTRSQNTHQEQVSRLIFQYQSILKKHPKKCVCVFFFFLQIILLSRYHQKMFNLNARIKIQDSRKLYYLKHENFESGIKAEYFGQYKVTELCIDQQAIYCVC